MNPNTQGVLEQIRTHHEIQWNTNILLQLSNHCTSRAANRRQVEVHMTYYREQSKVLRFVPPPAAQLV